MAKNEKIRSEDVLEVLDQKILASQGHPQIDVLPLENYQSVLNKVAARALSLAQKAAFNSARTVPSTANPVVLKNDLMTYVPAADLGDPRDSVATFAQLPVPFYLIGCALNPGSYIVTLPPSVSVVRGLLVTGANLPDNTLVVDILSPTSIQISSEPNITSPALAILTFSPVLGELRPVLSEGIIYRWNGSAWVMFIRTGTMDHTHLINQNGDPQYQHLASGVESALLTNRHFHANKTLLDQIISLGSGSIISDDERQRLPTEDQKLAMVGTAGTPSASNPFVTTTDIRLDTARNPFVTIGPPGSGASFTGVDYRPFDDALLAISIGAASGVKAIEVLPADYDLAGVTLTWEQPDCLLIEGFTARTATLKFRKIQTDTITAGIKALSITGGRLIVRGLFFEVNDLDTLAIISERPNTLIEHCSFTNGITQGERQGGVILSGAGSVIRSCQFSGSLAYGIKVTAPNCRITSCTFNLTGNVTGNAILFEQGSDFSTADHNTFSTGDVVVTATASFVSVSNNILTSSNILDQGISTRYLENQPEDKNQPFIGKKRTVGPLGTYADYRGSTEAAFNSALADPLVTEIEVLEGTYTFATPITVPEGKSIRGVKNADDQVVLDGNLILSQNTRLEDLKLLKTVSATSVENIRILNCVFVSATNYSVSFTSTTDAFIQKCSFLGDSGVSVQSGLRTHVLQNMFNTVTNSLATQTGTKDHIKENRFLSVAPVLQGSALLVENNQFTLIPSKLLTSNSIWQGNWPHPRANNDMGVDTIDLSFSNLEPIALGSFRSEIAGVGTVAFPEGQESSAASLAMSMQGSFVNKLASTFVTIYWSSSVTSGSVMWRVTLTWRDAVNKVVGSFVQNAGLSPRTQPDPMHEDWLRLEFANYNISTDPTHLSIIVDRLGDDPTDTMNTIAHVTEIVATIPRD